MYHEDGIEVYLKPAGEENVKFAEFAVLDFDPTTMEHLNSRCVVHAREGPFEVVVRTRPGFKMFSANSLGVHVDVGDDLRKPWPNHVRQRSWVHDQSIYGSTTYYTPRENGVANRRVRRHMPYNMVTVEKASKGHYDQIIPGLLNASPCQGSIVVTIGRMKSAYRYGRIQLAYRYGPGDPAQYRQYIKKSEKPLASQNGAPYYFEFQYRSEGFVRRAHSAGAEDGHHLDIQEIALIPDTDFVRIREADKIEREKTSAAFQRRQERRRKADKTEEEKIFAALRPLFEQRQAAISAGESKYNSASGASLSQHAPASKPRKKKHAPQFCDCSDGSRKHAGPTKRTTTAWPRLGLPRIGKPSTADKDDATDGESQSAVNDEPMPDAPVCGSCKSLKVPKSSRPAFLRKWYYDNGNIETNEDNEDSEEPARTDTTPAAHDVEVTDQNNHGVSGQSVSEGNPAGEQDTKLYPQRESHKARGASVVEDLAAAARFRAQLTTWETYANAEDQQETMPGDVAYADAWQGEVLRASQAHAAQVHATEAVSSAPAVPPSVERKRRAETIEEQRPAKKKRVDVDLTIDDDDGLVQVKMETTSSSITRPFGSLPALDGQDIEATLKAVNLDLREVQLERKKAELEQQLREQHRRRQMDRSIRVKGVIKIED